MPARVAHPESIVETDWVAGHLDDADLRLVEVDVDLGSYAEGHVPGALQWDWTSHLNDSVQRDILDKRQMQRLMGESGIDRKTRVVLYGDNNNWFAAYAFWQLKLYGHLRVQLMNGGRQKWVAEGRPLSAGDRGALPSNRQGARPVDIMAMPYQVRPADGQWPQSISVGKCRNW